jgi:hypothetical protein
MCLYSRCYGATAEVGAILYGPQETDPMCLYSRCYGATAEVEAILTGPQETDPMCLYSRCYGATAEVGAILTGPQETDPMCLYSRCYGATAEVGPSPHGATISSMDLPVATAFHNPEDSNLHSCRPRPPNLLKRIFVGKLPYEPECKANPYFSNDKIRKKPLF